MKRAKKAKAAKKARKAKPGAPARAFASGEHVRIVPLHQPKPALAIADLARMRREVEEGGETDLFDGRPHAAPAGAKLTYRKGPLLTRAEVFSIFWGAKWGTTASSTKLMNDLNRFFEVVLASPAIDQLDEYSVGAKKIGHGRFLGMQVISAQAPVGSVTNSVIRQRLAGWIQSKVVPKNTKNSLYFIFLEPHVVSVLGGSRSCHNYCGYHDSSGSLYYAVMPYPGCDGCLGGLSVFDALTGTSSHELCEAITDPVPGSGWYDDTNGEIGDICPWSFKKVGGYTVQLEWSNRQGKCV
jgi:hypothetical protein